MFLFLVLSLEYTCTTQTTSSSGSNKTNLVGRKKQDLVNAYNTTVSSILSHSIHRVVMFIYSQRSPLTHALFILVSGAISNAVCNVLYFLTSIYSYFILSKIVAI